MFYLSYLITMFIEHTMYLPKHINIHSIVLKNPRARQHYYHYFIVWETEVKMSHLMKIQN